MLKLHLRTIIDYSINQLKIAQVVCFIKFQYIFEYFDFFTSEISQKFNQMLVFMKKY